MYVQLSIIIPFRASEDRAYIMERLKQFEINKDKLVEYILVDSGSPYSLQEEIKQICNFSKKDSKGT